MPPSASSITQAFLLCAGLGTRMRPLTDILPKPLLPLFQESMVEYTIKRYRRQGVNRFIINTHHLADCWHNRLEGIRQDGCRVDIVHEPILLDTGGGLKNIADRIDRSSPLLIHNGDIITTIDTRQLIQKHLSSGALATLALRSRGELGNVGYDQSTGLVTDMRHALGVNKGNCEFASVYCIEPSIINMIPDGPVSIVPVLLELIRRKEVAGLLIDDGAWYNVGDTATYLRMHRELASILPADQYQLIHPTASIDPTAVIDGATSIGHDASVGAHCTLTDCVVWPGVNVPASTTAQSRIFYQ